MDGPAAGRGAGSASISSRVFRGSAESSTIERRRWRGRHCLLRHLAAERPRPTQEEGDRDHQQEPSLVAPASSCASFPALTGNDSSERGVGSETAIASLWVCHPPTTSLDKPCTFTKRTSIVRFEIFFEQRRHSTFQRLPSEGLKDECSSLDMGGQQDPP